MKVINYEVAKEGTDAGGKSSGINETVTLKTGKCILRTNSNAVVAPYREM